MKAFSHKIALASTAGLLLPLMTQAGTIVWGGAEGTQNYSSDGTALEAGTSSAVTFQLGVFQDPSTGAEFSPSFSNAAQWAANWVPFGALSGSQADYQGAQADRADALTENFFRGTVDFGSGMGQTETSASSDGVTFNTATPLTTIGYQVYIWGFEDGSQVLNAGDSPEWILFTGIDATVATAKDTDWVIPDSSDTGNGTFAAAWDVNSADTAIVGRIPDAPDGEGEITNTPPTLTDSDIQFASVPEPSSALLLVIGMVSPVLRRRR